MTHETAEPALDLSIRGCLTRQLDVAWALASYHLEGLSTEECLWRPATHGLHVHLQSDGSWRSDWPEHEGYDLGPPSIAWLTWHVGYWWSMVLDHSFGTGSLTREALTWPGSAEAARAWVNELHSRWRAELTRLTTRELSSRERANWPIQDRPFMDIVAWANLELMKNASEIGYARFLYATRAR